GAKDVSRGLRPSFGACALKLSEYLPGSVTVSRVVPTNFLSGQVKGLNACVFAILQRRALNAVNSRVEEDEPVEGQRYNTSHECSGSCDCDQGRVPKVEIRPGKQADHDPRAGDEKPEESSQTNSPAHGRSSFANSILLLHRRSTRIKRGLKLPRHLRPACVSSLRNPATYAIITVSGSQQAR